MSTIELKRKMALAVCPELEDEIKELKRQLIKEKKRNAELTADRDFFRGFLEKDPNYLLVPKALAHNSEIFEEFMNDPNKHVIITLD